MSRKAGPRTPDGRYFVSRGKLWRCTNPGLPDTQRRAAIKAMMQGRRASQLAQTDADKDAADAAIHAAKLQLGERGPVWWDDGAPDEQGVPPARSTYAAWWNGLDAQTQALGA